MARNFLTTRGRHRERHWLDSPTAKAAARRRVAVPPRWTVRYCDGTTGAQSWLEYSRQAANRLKHRAVPTDPYYEPL